MQSRTLSPKTIFVSYFRRSPIQFRTSTKYFLSICALLSLIMPVVYAKDYKVEVIVFENLNAANATKHFEFQTLDELPSPDKLWSIAPSMLLNEAKDLDNSSNYQVLHHFSWGQKSRPLSQAASYNLTENNLTGRIKVYARQLLFANLNLNFNGYQINEKRRIKLNERHFYDHPKFGILMQVSRLQPN